jgi:hypothetical protein
MTKRLLGALGLLTLGILLMLCSYWFDQIWFVWAAIVVFLSGNFLTPTWAELTTPPGSSNVAGSTTEVLPDR